MVICTDKKYVFVKVYKTGGTSIYHELRKHSKSQNNLGHMYHHGIIPTGVLQDYNTAVKWFRLSAEQGDVSAQYNLGQMYRNGQGVPQDDKTAVKWYRLAADQGDAYAQYNLGFMYEKGKGVPQDYKTAVKWFRLAAEQGYAFAQFNLGVMYEKGRGVSQDYKTAVKWYRLAAERGHDSGDQRHDDSGVKRKHDHVKSSWIKENIFLELGLDWDKYFKFGFVRNPWDRELSNYFFNSGKLKPPEDISFKEWLNIRLQKNGFIRSHNSPQCDYLTDVNYVARFENYDEEVKYLFNRIGVPMPQPLMHINKTDHKPYYEYYDDIDIMKVHQWYEKDIEMYNYEFGE